jgi:hypothetical protein
VPRWSPKDDGTASTLEPDNRPNADSLATVNGMWKRSWLIPVLTGAAVLVTGVAIALQADAQGGWFAYSSDKRMSGSVVRFVTDRELAGWVIAVLGLVVVAAAVGYHAGLRRSGGAAGGEPGLGRDGEGRVG